MGSTPRLAIDGGISNQLARVVEAAGGLEEQGYDGTNKGWDPQAYSQGRLNLGWQPNPTPYRKRVIMPWSHPAGCYRPFRPLLPPALPPH